MQMRHVEIVYSVKTKSTENWICVWLEVASIFLSLVFEKKKKEKKKKWLAKKLFKMIRCRCVFSILIVYCDKIFK